MFISKANKGKALRIIIIIKTPMAKDIPNRVEVTKRKRKRKISKMTTSAMKMVI